MIVKFSKGIKATEYGLKDIPRVGDTVRLENMSGKVESVTWNFGTCGQILTPPWVSVILQ